MLLKLFPTSKLLVLTNLFDGTDWEGEFVKDENTNLVVQLHWDYWRDKSPGLSTTVCLGDIGSEPTYKEFDFYLLDNLLEDIKFAESF